MGFRVGIFVGLLAAIGFFYFESLFTFPANPHPLKEMAKFIWTSTGLEVAVLVLLVGVPAGWVRGGATLAGFVVGALLFGELISLFILWGLVPS